MACSDDETRASATTTGTASTGGSTGVGGAGGGTGGTEIPNTDCVETEAVGAVVYPGGTALAVDQLVATGARFAATGEAGLVFFDADGQNADATPSVLRASRHVVASEGDKVAVSAFDSEWLSIQRIASDGVPLGGLAGISQDRPQLTATAAAPWGTTVVWAYNTRIYARTWYDVTMSAEYDVGIGAYTTFVFLQAGARGNEIGVVWSGDATAGANQSWFRKIDSTGPVGEEAALIYETAGVHNVTSVVGTDDGFMVMFTGDAPDFEPVMMRLDADGAPRGGAVRLDGAQFSQSMASQGSSVMVVAGRATGEMQMRPFDLDLSPLGPWVCIGTDYNEVLGAAITPDGAGYAVMHTTDGGALTLHRTNDTGEGAL